MQGLPERDDDTEGFTRKCSTLVIIYPRSEKSSLRDVYFSGKNPDFSPPLHLIGTDFRVEVWEILRTIPYVQTVSYAEIARQLALRRGLSHLSAQAVGGAIAHNPISLLVPCHRVIRTGGDLGGYAAGAEKKKALLRLEYLPAGTPMSRILMEEETAREAIEAVYDLLNP